MIEWFTKNFDKEIGALGIGEVKDGVLIVDKLVFPEQEVTSCHVHFGPEHWKHIVKELSVEELGKIIFYWHKHPSGIASSSQGDEDDTYDVFMDETSGREVMGFLVTSPSNGSMTQDCRIEMRKPIWASIPAEMISEEENDMEEVCEKIIEDKIVEPKPIPTVVYKNPNNLPSTQDLADLVGKINTGKDKKITRFKSSNENLEKLFEAMMTNGMGIIVVNQALENYIDGFLIANSEIIGSEKKKAKGEVIRYDITPKKGCHKKLLNEIKGLMHQLNIDLESIPGAQSDEDDWKEGNECMFDPITERNERKKDQFFY